MQLIIKVLSVVAGASLLAVVVSGAKGMKPIFEIQRERNDKPKVGQRIVNGETALPNEFPFAVQVDIIEIQLSVIEIDLITQDDAICSGNIIAPQVVMTAGHCVNTNSQNILGLVTTLDYKYRIRGGSVDINSATFDVTTKHAIRHELYDPKTLVNDIALLVLSSGQAFVFKDPNVKPLRLGDDPSLLNENHVIRVDGYGKTSTTATVTSTTLQATNLFVVSYDYCQNFYTDTIPHTSFCAESRNNPKSSICAGDSGGAALAYDNTFYYGVGIAAFGSDTGCNGVPQGFTNTIQLRGWINAKFAENNLQWPDLNTYN